MLMMAAILFVGGPTQSRQGSDELAGQSIPAITCHTTSLINGILISRPLRRSTFSPFIPWKSRSKIVLEETNHEVVDECDLGPAIPPLRLLKSVPIRTRVKPRYHAPAAAMLII